MSVLALFLRTKFRLTSREGATRSFLREAERSVGIARDLGPELAAKPIRVGKMLGVDEDMRDWSIYETLEHNRIVNDIFAVIIDQLANGGPPPAEVDPKKDVMPEIGLGEEVVAAFEESVERCRDAAARATKLRGTERRPHPLFGSFDAHMWYCMGGTHLEIHRKQMEAGAKLLRETK